MGKFIIEGGHELSGSITASGNKNAALKLLPACLLTDQPVTLHNMPNIADVRVMRQIIADLGADVEDLGGGSWRIHAENITKTQVNPTLAQNIRASIVLAGPMLARTGHLEIMPPGGDSIGRRRLDTHVLALEKLGARVDFLNEFRMNADGLHGANILLDEASVTATENALMAATLAKGTTVIRNAASEPHVQDMCNFLTQLGAQIEGIGSNQLTIHGVDKLHGTEFRVGADYTEVGSLIGAAVVTGGEVRIRQAAPQHLDMIALTFRRLGVVWDVEGEDIIVRRGQSLTIVPDIGNRIPEIKAQPWPGFPTDLVSIAIVIATQAIGTVLFHEWMFEDRLYFVDKLNYMSARTVVCDPHRVLVLGPTRLQGDTDRITSPDIRAGMAMLLAALCAQGTTVIRNIGQIDRGYENIEGRLRALGAKIERVADDG